MAPESGWYPDPAEAAQLRFWDGRSWTSTTAAQVPAQTLSHAPEPAYAYAPGAAAKPSYGSNPQSSGSIQRGLPPQAPARRRKRFYGVIAGVVSVAAVAAIAIPLTTNSSKAPTPAHLNAVLLTAAEVNQTVSGHFTSAPATNDGPGTTSDCKDTVNIPKGAEKATAGREFTDTSQFVEEDLSYTDGAAALFAGLKAQVSKCHTITTDGTSLIVTILSAPTVEGSDDTFGMAATGTVSGTHIAVVIDFARFGNRVIMLTYGGQAPAAAVADNAHQLIRKAAAKAATAY